MAGPSTPESVTSAGVSFQKEPQKVKKGSKIIRSVNAAFLAIAGMAGGASPQIDNPQRLPQTNTNPPPSKPIHEIPIPPPSTSFGVGQDKRGIYVEKNIDDHSKNDKDSNTKKYLTDENGNITLNSTPLHIEGSSEVSPPEVEATPTK